MSLQRYMSWKVSNVMNVIIIITHQTKHAKLYYMYDVHVVLYLSTVRCTMCTDSENDTDCSVLLKSSTDCDRCLD